MLYAGILLAVSLSIDALGLGISYGIQGIKVLLLPKLLICFSSIIYSILGLAGGGWLLHKLGADTADKIGVVILILMGLWMILKSGKNNSGIKEKVKGTQEQQRKLAEIAIKSLGITVMVIKNPVRGDIDNSGVIDIKEAAILGLALNMDAAAACMGSTMIGVSSILIPIFIGVVQMLFISIGVWAGKNILSKKVINERLISVIPGLILISLALIRIFGDIPRQG